MQAKSVSLLIIACFLSLAFLWQDSHAHLRENGAPTAVGLVSFSAATHANGVLLTWETATELSTAGFIFHRRTGSVGDFVYLENIGLIDSEGGPATGYIYQVVDETAVLSQTYTYRLIEIENDNSQNTLEDVTITVGATPTPTPSHTPTATPTTATGAGATATPTPTATASPTRAPNSNVATATPTPTTSNAGQPPANPTRILTVTPISSGSGPDAPSSATQATAVPANNNLLPTNPTPNPTVTIAPTTPPDALGRGEVALAQGLETSPPTDDPRSDTSPGQLFPADSPPDSDASTETSGAAAPTALAVIGDTTAYDAPGQPPTDTAQTSETAGRSTLFLWIGFIVALLIFITGVVGSIILYTRRTK